MGRVLSPAEYYEEERQPPCRELERLLDNTERQDVVGEV